MNWETHTMLLEYDEATDIITVRPNPKFKGPETRDQAAENTQSMVDKVGNTIKGGLAYLPNHYINAEATLYYKNHLPNVPVALIEDSFFKKMIGNFILAMSRPGRPIHIFNDLEKAQEWLCERIAEKERQQAG